MCEYKNALHLPSTANGLPTAQHQGFGRQKMRQCFNAKIIQKTAIYLLPLLFSIKTGMGQYLPYLSYFHIELFFST
jgi:hypothetical protein